MVGAEKEIKCFSNVCISLHNKDKKGLLEKVSGIIEFFESREELIEFIQCRRGCKKEVVLAVLKEFKATIELSNAIQLLCDKGYAHHILSLLNRIEEELLEQLDIRTVLVFSAAKLSMPTRNSLEEAIRKSIDRDMSLTFHYHLDPSLILGVKIRIGDFVQEYSLKSEMEKVKNMLTPNSITF